MVLHRAHTMSRSYNHFTCRTYKKDGTLCTAHYIRECVLDDVVLEDLRRVTAMAREHTQEFAAYIGSRQSAEIRKEMCGLERGLVAMQKRSRELDSIFKRLYEDSVLGRITAEQFQTLSGSYTQEMEALNKTIPEKEAAIQRLREQVSGTDHFISLAKRYTDIQELTPELLRLFIQKIVVHEKDVKWSKHAQQTVEIHYNDIGYVELTPPEGQSTTKGAWGKKSPRQILPKQYLPGIRTPAKLPLSGDTNFLSGVFHWKNCERKFYQLRLPELVVSLSSTS